MIAYATPKLPENFAEDVINLEMDIEKQDPVDLQSVTKLIELYTIGVEYYESIKSERYIAFQQKINKLLARDNVMKAMIRQSMGEQKYKEMKQNEIQLQKDIELKQIQEQQEKMMHQSQSEVQQNLKIATTSIRSDISTQQEQLMKRIQLRKKTKQTIQLARSASQPLLSLNTLNSLTNQKQQECHNNVQKQQTVMNFGLITSAINEDSSNEEEDQKEIEEEGQNQNSKERGSQKQETLQIQQMQQKPAIHEDQTQHIVQQQQQQSQLQNLSIPHQNSQIQTQNNKQKDTLNEKDQQQKESQQREKQKRQLLQFGRELNRKFKSKNRDGLLFDLQKVDYQQYSAKRSRQKSVHEETRISSLQQQAKGSFHAGININNAGKSNDKQNTSVSSKQDGDEGSHRVKAISQYVLPNIQKQQQLIINNRNSEAQMAKSIEQINTNLKDFGDFIKTSEKVDQQISEAIEGPVESIPLQAQHKNALLHENDIKHQIKSEQSEDENTIIQSLLIQNVNVEVQDINAEDVAQEQEQEQCIQADSSDKQLNQQKDNCYQQQINEQETIKKENIKQEVAVILDEVTNIAVQKYKERINEQQDQLQTIDMQIYNRDLSIIQKQVTQFIDELTNTVPEKLISLVKTISEKKKLKEIVDICLKQIVDAALKQYSLEQQQIVTKYQEKNEQNHDLLQVQQQQKIPEFNIIEEEEEKQKETAVKENLENINLNFKQMKIKEINDKYLPNIEKCEKQLQESDSPLKLKILQKMKGELQQGLLDIENEFTDQNQNNQ